MDKIETEEKDDFWENVYFDALDENIQFLERYQNHSRSYPKEEILGKGGVKVVYKSHDWKTDRDIALALPAKVANEDLSVEFIHEAIILGQLEHPNIIPVYDTGLDDSKTPYFTMKLVKGKDLRTHLNQNENISLKDIPELLDIFKKVCLAVSYAHSEDVVHLDIKPENVLIGQFGEVFLCDWGLSEKLNQVKKSIDEVSVKGTPGFMAPEKLLKCQADKRMDVYSLGCLLYFILSTKPPISGNGLTSFVSDLSNNDITPLELQCSFSVPQSLLQIFEKCCRQNPDERYQEVSEIIDDLELYTNGFATKAEEAGFLRNLSLLYRRNCVKINISLFFTFILTALTAYYIISLKESTRIAVAEKEKAEAFNKALIQKQEEDRKFLQETIDTADDVFSKSRPDSTKRFLENALMIDPSNQETMFNLAKVYLVDFKWKKAEALLNKVTDFDTENTEKLKALIVKYKDHSSKNQSKFNFTIEAYNLGFEKLYLNASDNLLNKIPDSDSKVRYIKSYLEMDNKIKNLDFTLDLSKGEMTIENAKLSRLRALKSLNLLTLRILNCEVNTYISNKIRLKTLDLRGSIVAKLDDYRLNGVETLYLPLNKIDLDLKGAKLLRTVYLPKKDNKKAYLKNFSGDVKFY